MQSGVQENFEFEVLSPLEVFSVVTKEMVHNVRDLVRNRLSRSSEKVRADYELGVWKDVLEKKPWRQCTRLLEYVIPDDEVVRVAMIRGRLVRIATRQYYQFRLRTLQKVLADYAQDTGELVELGCGTGLNLFSVSLSNRWDLLSGFDISENAIRAAGEAAQHFGLSNINFGSLDLTNQDDPNLKHLEGRTAFTYYCLEQLKYSTEAVIENLIRAGVGRVVHIENATELLRVWSLGDWLSYLYITRMDYQDNLLQTLESFKRKGLIHIVDKRRLGYAPTCKNDPMLVCWETI